MFVQGVEQVELPVENLAAAVVLAGDAALTTEADPPDAIAQAAHFGFDLDGAPRFKRFLEIGVGCHGETLRPVSVRRVRSRAS